MVAINHKQVNLGQVTDNMVSSWRYLGQELGCSPLSLWQTNDAPRAKSVGGKSAANSSARQSIQKSDVFEELLLHQDARLATDFGGVKLPLRNRYFTKFHLRDSEVGQLRLLGLLPLEELLPLFFLLSYVLFSIF